MDFIFSDMFAGLFLADCYSIIRRKEGQPPPTRKNVKPKKQTQKYFFGLVLLQVSPSFCSAADGNPSQLEALHDQHLQEEIDILEQCLSKIRGEHRLLVVQLRSKELN